MSASARAVAEVLVARWIGIISAARRVVGSSGSSAHRSSSDAYRYPAAHRYTTVNTTAIDTTMIDAGATNADASSKCRGVS